MSTRKVGIHCNSTKDNASDIAWKLIRILRERGVKGAVTEELCELLGRPDSLTACGFDDCEFLIVLGGDGTILRALDLSIPHDIPILGINLGRLGFLTQTDLTHMEEDIARALDGQYTIDERMIMCLEGYDEDEFFALNEIIVDRSTPEVRILSMEYEANGCMVNRIAGDGLIVSTSTGSTAYSLSAGGPIVSPTLDCFVLTPICPHILNVRPVVLSASDRITVRLKDDRNGARAVLDGRKIVPLRGDKDLVIRRSSRNARFVRLHEENWFELLRGKLSEWTY